MVHNQEIAELFTLSARLLELYGENKFKIRSYTNAAQLIKELEEPLAELDGFTIEQMEGIGTNIAKKIHQILEAGTFEELQRLLDKTPEGIIELLQIKGIGPKKVKTAWESLGIESPEAFLRACENQQIQGLKGFGKKTEDNIREALRYYQKSKQKLILPHAEEEFHQIRKLLENDGVVKKVHQVGPLRRKCPTIPSLDFQVMPAESETEFQAYLARNGYFTNNGQTNPQWFSKATGLPLNFYFSNDQEWHKDLFFNTGSEAFVQAYNSGESKVIADDSHFFEAKGESYLPPELREPYWLENTLSADRLEQLVQQKHLKGCLHNHSQFSDGANSIQEMAEECRRLGLGYFGIADHSKAAFYANGLDEKRLTQQSQEVARLNEALDNFRIFHGIEADILSDGQLDFDYTVLKALDYVVASVHTPLKMDKEKATQRLITAIENPFTTILGHMTGRLLLRREGYPVDHEKVIDACAANNVVIEINANPRRLDLDWEWMDFALNKGCMLSINPDAHNLQGIQDMAYGVYAARKGGVPWDAILNTKTKDDAEVFFSKRKEGALESTHYQV